ncbi:MAG TPA: hypothetical protein VF481_01240 [Novosphingobium sp.]
MPTTVGCMWSAKPISAPMHKFIEIILGNYVELDRPPEMEFILIRMDPALRQKRTLGRIGKRRYKSGSLLSTPFDKDFVGVQGGVVC